MRAMNLPELPAPPTSADECVKIYLKRLPADDATWPHASLLLTAYLAWPNDTERRNSFVATDLARFGEPSDKRASDFSDDSRTVVAPEMFGGLHAIAKVAFDQLSAEINQLQHHWLLVADIFQLIVDMAYDRRAVLSRGPSISKAVDLCELERGLPGHSQLRGAWSQFRDVAHLLTASAYLAHEGLAQATATNEASILKAIWIAPDAVLALAYGLQEFGLQPKPIRKESPILSPNNLWRIPSSHKPEKPFIVFRRLSEIQLTVLNSKRVKKEVA
jgi:hypothetical protein